MVGREFGGYQLLRELGVGGMGVVYLGEHRLLGRKAAIKTIRTEIANDRNFSRRFLLEARAVGALNHPSIVRLYDFAFEEDTPYMVMEYLTGQSLEDVLGGGRRLDPRAAVELLTPVAAALDHAHKHGVVHRDVKPANVLLADDGRTLIMDFGLASLAGFSMTADPEAFVGTPDYIAPEQVAGEPVDGRADVYSLAAVIFETVTGDRPWLGRTWMEIARRRLTDPPPVARDMPAEFAGALMAGMARQPDHRPRTATALLESLSATLEHASQPVAFRQTVRSRAVVDAASPPGSGPAGSGPAGVNGGGHQAPPDGVAAPAGEPVAERPASPAVADTAAPAPAAAASQPRGQSQSQQQRSPATEPRIYAVEPSTVPSATIAAARASVQSRMPLVSLVVVAVLIGLAMAAAWLTVLQEPVSATVHGLVRH